MPKNATQVMKNLAYKSRTNFLPLVLDAFTQVIKADGYLEANGKESKAWKHWQANKLDARQTGFYRPALQYGAVLRVDPARRHGPGHQGLSRRGG
jgi:hypothetical protein